MSVFEKPSSVSAWKPASPLVALWNGGASRNLQSHGFLFVHFCIVARSAGGTNRATHEQAIPRLITRAPFRKFLPAALCWQHDERVLTPPLPWRWMRASCFRQIDDLEIVQIFQGGDNAFIHANWSILFNKVQGPAVGSTIMWCGFAYNSRSPTTERTSKRMQYWKFLHLYR